MSLVCNRVYLKAYVVRITEADLTKWVYCTVLVINFSVGTKYQPSHEPKVVKASMECDIMFMNQVILPFHTCITFFAMFREQILLFSLDQMHVFLVFFVKTRQQLYFLRKCCMSTSILTNFLQVHHWVCWQAVSQCIMGTATVPARKHYRVVQMAQNITGSSLPSIQGIKSQLVSAEGTQHY